MAYSNGKYLEAEVYSADPIKLVCLLYAGAIEAIVKARRHLAAGEISQRSRQIQRALAILRELSRSLDPQYEEISGPLAHLYAYMISRLLEANAKQIDEPLAEVERLFSTLHDGWKSVLPTLSPEPSGAPYQAVSCTY